MEFLSIFVLYLVTLLLGYLFSYLTGLFFLAHSQNNDSKPFHNIFISTFIGQLAISALTAIYFTKGKTVLMAYAVIYLFYLFYTKRYRNILSSSNVKTFSNIPWLKLFLGCLIFLFAFSWSFYIAMNPNVYGHINVPNFRIGEYQDYFQYYTNVSYFIKETGIENINRVSNFISSKYHFTAPYHYYDLWHNSAFSNLTNGNYLKTQYLISRPLMLGTSLLGILSIAEYFTQVKIKHLVYAITFAFVGPLAFQTLSNHFAYFDYINSLFDFMLLITPHKTAYYYSFIIAGILFIKSNKWLYAIFSFSALGIATITAFPATFAICLIIPISLILLKKICTKELLIMYSCIVLTYLLFALPQLNGNKDTFELYSITDLIKASIGNQTLGNFILTSFKADIHKASYYVLLYLIPISIVVLTKRKALKVIFTNNLILIISLFTLFSASMLTWNILFCIHDSYQFFIHPVAVSFNTITFFVLLDLLNKTKFKIASHLTLGLCISVNFYLATKRISTDQKEMNPYSNEYLKKTESITNQEKNLKIIASIRKSISFNDRYFQGAFIYFYGHQLTQFQNNFGFVGIDDFIMTFDYKEAHKNKAAMNGLKKSPFFNFVQEEKKKGIEKTIEQYQVDFLKKNHIQYLITDKEVILSNELKNLVIESVQDVKSGEFFYVLNTH